MAEKTGHFAIIEQFLAEGMNYMFGNPGTVEQGFLDSMAEYPELKYFLTLQESVAVLVADGYARASGKPALVQIHSSPGLGNAIGALYQAKRGHSPLVVVSGDAGVKYQALDAQMAADLVAMAEPVTKWATMVTDPSSLLRVLRRAVKVALTPPRGPVYVCLPQDMLDAPAVEDVQPASMPSTRVVPDGAWLRTAAELLGAARTPMILVGDGIAASGAQGELTRVAELLGAEVWEADAGEVNMSRAHPLYQGATGHMFASQSRPITTKGDAYLVCGTYLLPEVFPELGPIFAPGAKVVHVDLDPSAIAKNHPVDLGAVSDPKLTLDSLASTLDHILSPEQRQAAATRAGEIGAAKATREASAAAGFASQRDRVPMHFSQFMEELSGRLPNDAVIFDEALTNSPAIGHFRPAEPGNHLLTRGGSLGVGIPGAIGVKVAHPEREVWGFTGDGGAMYTIQALWSAARHGVGAKFVVCNNRSYRLLQANISAYWAERDVAPHPFPLSFDLSNPAIRFDELARSMGVEAARVEHPDEIGTAIDKALSHDGPFLLDVVVEGDVHPDLIGVRCGQ